MVGSRLGICCRFVDERDALAFLRQSPRVDELLQATLQRSTVGPHALTTLELGLDGGYAQPLRVIRDDGLGMSLSSSVGAIRDIGPFSIMRSDL